MQYRLARETDIPAMARIRAEGWGTREYWERRIAGYMSGDVHPHESLPQRVAYVAVDESQDDSMAGLVAGHLTHRLECDGELEWINVAQEHRTAGVGFQLMVMMARWFDWMNARRILRQRRTDEHGGQEFLRRHGGPDARRQLDGVGRHSHGAPGLAAGSAVTRVSRHASTSYCDDRTARDHRRPAFPIAPLVAHRRDRADVRRRLWRPLRSARPQLQLLRASLPMARRGVAAVHRCGHARVRHPLAWQGVRELRGGSGHRRHHRLRLGRRCARRRARHHRGRCDRTPAAASQRAEQRGPFPDRRHGRRLLVFRHHETAVSASPPSRAPTRGGWAR